MTCVKLVISNFTSVCSVKESHTTDSVDPALHNYTAVSHAEEAWSRGRSASRSFEQRTFCILCIYHAQKTSSRDALKAHFLLYSKALPTLVDLFPDFGLWGVSRVVYVPTVDKWLSTGMLRNQKCIFMVSWSCNDTHDERYVHHVYDICNAIVDHT